MGWDRMGLHGMGYNKVNKNIYWNWYPSIGTELKMTDLEL